MSKVKENLRLIGIVGIFHRNISTAMLMYASAKDAVNEKIEYLESILDACEREVDQPGTLKSIDEVIDGLRGSGYVISKTIKSPPKLSVRVKSEVARLQDVLVHARELLRGTTKTILST